MSLALHVNELVVSNDVSVCGERQYVWSYFTSKNVDDVSSYFSNLKKQTICNTLIMKVSRDT